MKWEHIISLSVGRTSAKKQKSLYSFVTTFFRIFPEDPRDVRWLYFYTRENQMSSLAVQTHESVRHEGLCPSCTLISPWDTSISFFILLLYTPCILCVSSIFFLVLYLVSQGMNLNDCNYTHTSLPYVLVRKRESVAWHEGRLERKEQQEHADCKETLLLSWDTDNSVKDVVILRGHHRLSRRCKRSMSKSFVKGDVLWYSSKKKKENCLFNPQGNLKNNSKEVSIVFLPSSMTDGCWSLAPYLFLQAVEYIVSDRVRQVIFSMINCLQDMNVQLIPWTCLLVRTLLLFVSYTMFCLKLQQLMFESEVNLIGVWVTCQRTKIFGIRLKHRILDRSSFLPVTQDMDIRSFISCHAGQAIRRRKVTEERTAGEEKARIDGHLFFILYDAPGRKRREREE